MGGTRGVDGRRDGVRVWNMEELRKRSTASERALMDVTATLSSAHERWHQSPISDA